jgi:hypothetical protein
MKPKFKKIMRYKMLLGLGLILVTSCGTTNNDNIMTGDLYFSFFRVGTYYNLPDSTIKKMEADLNAVNLDSADNALIELVKDYQKLKDEGLIYKPVVDVMTEDELTIKLLLDSADYDKIKIYKHKNLVDNNKKLRIKAKTRKTGLNFYYCTDLLGVTLVDGQTLPYDNKLKILDYN